MTSAGPTSQCLQWLSSCASATCRFPVDGYGMVQSGRLEGWRPDADLYEQLIAWMCTQEDLVDVAEQIVRQELPVRACLFCHTCREAMITAYMAAGCP